MPSDIEREDEDPQNQQALAEVSVLKDYVKKISLALFYEEGGPSIETSLSAAVNSVNSGDAFKRFISESQVRGLVVQGIVQKGQCQTLTYNV